MVRTPALFVLLLTGALVTYKVAGSVRVIDHVRAGAGFPASNAAAGLDLVSRSIDYLAVVWPALVSAFSSDRKKFRRSSAAALS